MSKSEHSDSEFYYPEQQEIVTTGSGDDDNENNNSQEKIEDILKEQKSANTARKTTSDLETLQRYLLIDKGKIGMVNLPAPELDHLLAKFFKDVHTVNGDEYEPDSVSSFQRSIHRFLTDQKYPHNILKDNEFERSRRVLAAKRQAAGSSGLAQRIDRKVRNQSVRKTSISRVLDANTPENFVAQLSGHKNTQSLQSYKSANEQHQRQMSNILSRTEQPPTKSLPAPSQGPSSHASGQFIANRSVTVQERGQLMSMQSMHSFSMNIAGTLPSALQGENTPAVFTGQTSAVAGCNFQIFERCHVFDPNRSRRLFINLLLLTVVVNLLIG